MTLYFVSRQAYWGVEPEDAYIVEVAIGGCDYANADMLTCRWPSLGEGREFSNPIEAVDAAIEICNAWRKDGCITAHVGYGATGGGTMPFDPLSYDNARTLAQAAYDKLPKCDQCGELLGKETFTHPWAMNDEKYCREYCAEKAYAAEVEASAEAEAQYDSMPLDQQIARERGANTSYDDKED
jgi:hypothetical protein